MDVYATSKVCMERIAESFARRSKGVDIYCLRIGAVIEPERFGGKFNAYVEQPERWKAHAWSYTDARDLGTMIDCCLKKDGLGYQVFNAVNDEITNNEETKEFLERVCLRTEIVGELGARQAPVSNRKIKEWLGFRKEFTWLKVLAREA